MAKCPVCSSRAKKENFYLEDSCVFCCPPDMSFDDSDVNEELNLLMNPSGRTPVRNYEEDQEE